MGFSAGSARSLCSSCRASDLYRVLPGTPQTRVSRTKILYLGRFTMPLVYSLVTTDPW